MHIQRPKRLSRTSKFCKSNSSKDACGSNVSIQIKDSPQAVDDDQHQFDGPNFSISQERLIELIEINDVDALEQSGGIQQIAAALGTDIEAGIAADERDVICRLRAFGLTQEPEGLHIPIPKSFSDLVLEALKDSTIILLLCCATLSLLIGIKTNGPEEGLLDGALIFLAIIIVVNFGLVFRYFKTKIMLKKLQEMQKKDVSVLRQGMMREISVSDLMVGDVAFLEAGNQVPADGFFIDGHSFKLDDGLVGRGTKQYSSMFSGAKVEEGSCRLLVASVGKNTERSKSIGKVRNQRKPQESKLQTAIDKMNSRLEKLSLSLSLFILFVQVLRCFLLKSASDKSHHPDPKGVKNTVEEIMNEATKLMEKRGGKANGLVSVLCVLLFAIRDGLPLGILVLLMCASKKMRYSGAMVQKLPACATVGSVTTICICKMDALTLKHSEMAELWIGLNPIKDVTKEVNKQVLKILQEGIGVNSSGQLYDSLLFWAKQVLGLDMDELFRNLIILHNESFDVDGNRCMSRLKRHEGTKQVLVLHWKGDLEFILSLCFYYYDADGTMQTLDEEKRASFSKMFDDTASNSLQCFAFAHKQVIPEGSHEEEGHDDDDEKTLKFMHHGLIFIGVVRLKNPYVTEVKEAVEAFRELGVKVKLIVDNDVKAARIMALDSGILRPEEDMEAAVIEASDLRNNSEETCMSMIDKIQVMANAKPSDKILMLQYLRKRGEVVAITSSCIRDSPSLIGADVGIFMGHHNVEVAKEDSDIIVGQNIGTIAAIFRIGRYVCNKMKIFLQLHLTLNVSAFTIIFTLEILESEVQLTPFHLLWTNLIVETLGAFALAILVEPPNFQLQGEISSPPIDGADPTITKTMWSNIAVQSWFQVTILLVLAVEGKDIFHVDDRVLRTMLFNCYVLCQIFTLIGSMKISQRLWIYENYLFIVVVGLIATLQVPLIEIMGIIAHWGKLDFKKWCICIGISALSVPIGYAARWISLLHKWSPDS